MCDDVSPEEAERMMREIIIGWSQSNDLDRQADYLQRGRAHAQLSADELRARWVEAYRAWGEAPHELHHQPYDVEAELRLRGLELPLLEVQDAIEKVSAEALRRYEAQKEDPAAWKAASEAFKHDLMAFAEGLDNAS